MAVLAAAALLDELMGRNRNVAPNEKGKELNWEDSEYCKYFLVKFCPHDLFVNTRADLGACAKVHDEEVKKLFDVARSHKKTFYQEEFVRFCSSMVNEVDRKIVKGKQRLALSGKNGEGASSLSPAQTQKNLDQINLLNERINGLVEEAEAAGNLGNVEQAQGLMKLCDQLKDERDNLKKMNDNSHWSATAELAAAQEKQMEVCEVCGAFLIVGDAQQRIDDHLMGKQHVGYARLKAAIQEVQSVIDEIRQKDDRRVGGGGGGGGRTSNIGGLGSGQIGGLGDDRRASERHYHHRDKRERDRNDSKIGRDFNSRDNNREKDRYKHHRNNREGGGGGGAGGGGLGGGPHRNRDQRRHSHHSFGGRDRERDRGASGGNGNERQRHSHRR